MKTLAKNNKRTTTQYKSLNPRLLHDLKQMVEILMQRMNIRSGDLEDYYEKKLSDNGLFYISGRDIYAMIRCGASDRYDLTPYNGNRYIRFIEIGNRTIEVCYWYDDESFHIKNGLDYCKAWFNDYLFEEYGYDNRARSFVDSSSFPDTHMAYDFPLSSFYRSTVFYYHKRLVECDELQEILENVFCSHVNKGVLPSDMHSFKINYDEVNKPMIQYTKGGRIVKMKAGKGIKKLLGIVEIDATDNQIKSVATSITSNFDDFELVEVSGSDIDKYYMEQNYMKEMSTGSLAQSCMRYGYCMADGYFEVYKDNASMLILRHKEEDKIIARAILWSNVYNHITEDRCMVLDRIYGSERVIAIFKSYCDNHGIFMKRWQSYTSESAFVLPKGCDEELYRHYMDEDYVNIRFTLDIDLSQYGCLPYMDTFAWSDGYETTNNYDFGHLCARETDGRLYGRVDDEYEDDEY